MRRIRKMSCYSAALSLCFLLWGQIGIGQNIVNNSGFELYSTCPDENNSIYFAVPWFEPQCGSSEYYHKCSLTPETIYEFSVQQPRTGDGMAGIWCEINYPWPWIYPSFIETELQQPLVAGKCYYAEFYVNLHNASHRATDALGMFFSDSAISSFTDTIFGFDTLHCVLHLPRPPQVRNPVGNIITDTVGWTKISGTFKAAGGERFLLIGNLWRKEECNYQIMVGTSEMLCGYFIDDVLVMECPDTVAPPDTTASGGIMIYPSPAVEWINVKAPGIEAGTGLTLEIYDMMGQLIKKNSFNLVSGVNTFYLDYLVSGVYEFRLRKGKEILKTQKVLVVLP